MHETLHSRRGFTRLELIIIIAIVVLLIAIILPSTSRTRHGSYRSICAANLKEIVQSLNVYGNDYADAFPIVPYASWAPALNRATAHAVSTDRQATIRSHYDPLTPQAGSVQAILWQFALLTDSSKPFVCREDPFARAPAALTDRAGRYHDNFPHPNTLSYSVAYPWVAGGKVAPWWKATIDATIPLMADVAPQPGTGKPPRNLTSSPLTAAANTGNHKGAGQNVAFGDNHVEFLSLPEVGGDNIFTASAVPPALPPPASRPGRGTASPAYDIFMLPARNETTGEY